MRGKRLLRHRLSAVDRVLNRGGFIFEDARFVAAKVEIDAEAVRHVLPLGLSPSRPPTATLFVAHYPSTTFGSVYSEVGLFVDVRHLFGRAAHCPWMLVDDDIALIAGRELLGYPKKLGRIELSLQEDGARATVDRRGARLLELRATFGEHHSSPPPMLGRRFLNTWGTVGLSLPRLLSFTPRERILEARRAEIELDVAGTERDPLDELGIGAVLDGWFYRVDIGGRRLPVPLHPVSPASWLDNWELRFR